MRFSRTALAGNLSKLYRKAFRSTQKDILPPPSNAGAPIISRKNFISDISLAGASLMVPGILKGIPGINTKTGLPASVAIIGGGIAGLNACRVLTKQGDQFSVTLYEGSKRTGGRIFTAKNLLGEGLTTELGGEFIDSTHTDMLELAQEYNLELFDCAKDTEENHFPDHTYFYGGKRRSEQEIIEQFTKLIPKIQADKELMGTEEGAERLDKISLATYIGHLHAEKWFRDLLYWAYTAEFGLDASQLSCLNFIEMVGIDTASTFEIFGDSDERFKVKGGNQRLTDAMTESLSKYIRYSHKLVALYRSGNKVGFQFENGRKGTADYVVLAIPFTLLRKVKIDPNLMLPLVKRQMITAMQYGTNSKMLLGYNDRLWRKQQSSGYVMNEVIQNGWDNSQMQQENQGTGGFTVFLGGKPGRDLTKDAALIKKYADQIEKIFPGAKEAKNNKNGVINWSKHPFALGSYAAYKTGQWSLLDTEEMMKPAGRLYFAGEHCSERFQGFMNGAAETGRKAAEGIITAVQKMQHASMITTSMNS